MWRFDKVETKNTYIIYVIKLSNDLTFSLALVKIEKLLIFDEHCLKVKV